MVTLESSKLFSRLSAPQLAMVRSSARELRFNKGSRIFKEGDPGDGIYIVQSGSVQISTSIESGEHFIFATVPAGEVFGEMAVLDQQPRSASASAATDTVAYFIGRDQLFALLNEAPELAINLLQEISVRLREFNRQYLRNVLQAERMALVGRFASSIVHDLKNPLTIIDMAAELGCASDSTPELKQEARGRIHTQVERVTHLVNDILEYTRGTPTAVKFAPENYAAFIRAFVGEVAPELKISGARIELENDPPQMTLPINRQRLGRVLHNLVNNAVDAMPQGGSVRLRFETNEAEVITRLEDSGKGIAPEIADSLFEPFATYGKQRGTGLGLSICQRIIQEHGGAIHAGNSPRGGAVFTFTLPRQR